VGILNTLKILLWVF